MFCAAVDYIKHYILIGHLCPLWIYIDWLIINCYTDCFDLKFTALSKAIDTHWTDLTEHVRWEKQCRRS